MAPSKTIKMGDERLARAEVEDLAQLGHVGARKALGLPDEPDTPNAPTVTTD